MNTQDSLSAPSKLVLGEAALQVQPEAVISKIDLYFIADSMNTRYFMFCLVNLICKYSFIPAIQACNTFQKKL